MSIQPRVSSGSVRFAGWAIRRLSSTSSTTSDASGVSKRIKKVGVFGLGLMGHGVAQVTAQAGYQVIGIESKQDALDIGFKRIETSLGKVISKDVQKGKYASEVTFVVPYDV